MAISENEHKNKGTTWDGLRFEENFTWEGVVQNTYIHAESTMALASALGDAKRNGYRSEYWYEGNNRTWDLGIGSDKSLKMAIDGWRGEGKYIEELARKCENLVLELPTQQIVRDVCGPIWDMPAVIEGHPYCALNFREEPAPELIKMVINGFYSGSVDAKSLQKRAAAISALVLTLHTAGYAMECTLIMPASIRGHRTLSEVVIHSPGDIFDLERLAFWMGHPAAVRNILYGIEGVFGNTNHGYSTPDTQTVAALKKKVDLEGAIYIDSMYSGEGGNQDSIRACSTEAGALGWIKAQVEQVKKWSLQNSEQRERAE